MSSCNESPGLVHLDMITHMLNQGGGAHKAIDRSVLYEEAQHEIIENAERLSKVKEKADRELDAFLADPKLTSIGFPAMEKVHRYLIHESADERGLVSYSIGEEEHGRHTIVWKKQAASSEELRKRMQATKEVRPDKEVLEGSFK